MYCPKKTSLIRYITVTALFASLLLLAGCDDEQRVSLRQRSLVYCSEGDPATFNPQQATSSIEFDASARVLFNQLLSYKPGSMQIQPSLAKSWSISKDGRHYIFELRRDVRFHSNWGWHPSRNFNSDDVIFSFNRQLDPKHPFHNVGGGHYQFFRANGLHHLIQDIIRRSDHRVEFVLKRPSTAFLSMLAMEFSSIQSAEYAQFRDHDREVFDSKPIGTGPFMLVRYQPRSFIRYRANPDYWQGKPEMSALVFAISREPSLRLARMLTGECDVMSQPLPSQLNLIRQDPKLTLVQQPGLNVSYWAFNTLKPPFNDVRVRRALSRAISRKDIIAAVFNGAAKIARGPLPPGMLGGDTNLPSFHQSALQARAQLNAAHWDFNHVIEIWTLPVQRSYNPDARKMAEIIQHDLSAIGVKSRIVSYEWTQFLDRLRKGQHQTVLLGWSADSSDPNSFLTPLLSCDGRWNGTNRAFWCNAKFDALLAAARNVPAARRAKLYQQAQLLFLQQMPWLPIAHTQQQVVFNSDIQGLKVSPTGSINFAGVTRKKHPGPMELSH